MEIQVLYDTYTITLFHLIENGCNSELLMTRIKEAKENLPGTVNHLHDHVKLVTEATTHDTKLCIIA